MHWHFDEKYASLPGAACGSCGIDDESTKKWYGVHRNHLRAFHATLKLQHPMDMQVPIPDILMETFLNGLTLGAAKVLEIRAAQFKRVLKLVKDLEREEKKLHDNMPRDVQMVLQGKRILVWRRLL